MITHFASVAEAVAYCADLGFITTDYSDVRIMVDDRGRRIAIYHDRLLDVRVEPLDC